MYSIEDIASINIPVFTLTEKTEWYLEHVTSIMRSTLNKLLSTIDIENIFKP